MADNQYEERTVGRVRRVAKVVQGGRRFSFTALMVVGDGNGTVGLGHGKAKEAGLAMQKAVEEAKKNLFEVALAGSTITHEILGGLSANDLGAATTNAVMAVPLGIIRGVDHLFTGRVERVDATLLALPDYLDRETERFGETNASEESLAAARSFFERR